MPVTRELIAEMSGMALPEDLLMIQTDNSGGELPFASTAAFLLDSRNVLAHLLAFAVSPVVICARPESNASRWIEWRGSGNHR